MKKYTKMILVGIGLVMVLGLSAFIGANKVSANSLVASFGPGMGRAEDHLEALADELDITLEDLQAVYLTAYQATIQARVEAGDITQDQADEWLEDLDDTDMPRGGRFGPRGFGVSDEFNPYLAEALGITVDKLTEAKDNVFQAEITQAVADGDITQEQADLMIARRAAQSYMADARRTAYKNAIAEAVTDGAITQAQADLLLANIEEGGFGGGRMGLGGGLGGRGGSCGGGRRP